MIRGFVSHRCLLLLLSTLCICSGSLAGEELDFKFEKLDEAFQILANDIYQVGAVPIRHINDPDLLFTLYSRQLSQQPVKAKQLVVSNLDTLSRNSGHPAIVSLSDSLLKNNERHLAEKIYSLTKESGNPTNTVYLNFTFAKYYARQRQWHRVQQLLKGTFADLSGKDVDYAYLLQGNALQHLKEHRKSVESYDNIPASSPYSIHALLNIAIANLRQGWITEARLIIEKILHASQNDPRNELTNRIYLILGYALLQKEYFRDARKAFRSIGLNSEYTNRALMGISLAAISQGDYVGGLNAVNALKQKGEQDLSSDEAYLIVPRIYQKLDQPLSIEGSFSESINRYQNRLLQLNALKTRTWNFEIIQLDQQTGDLVLDEIRFNFSQHFPRFLLDNRHNLSHLASGVSAPRLLDRIKTLTRQYDRVLNEAVATLVDQHIRYINSYLNQSRYGLARHYDNRLVGAQ